MYPHRRGGFGTVELIIKIGCFVKKKNIASEGKAAEVGFNFKI